MADCDSEYKKSSLRANAIEKKKLELILGTIEKAKKNMAVDLRKSQYNYRRQLKVYRDRQREILLSNASVPPTTASVGEFLLRQIISRNSERTRCKIPTRRPQTASAVVQRGDQVNGHCPKKLSPSAPNDECLKTTLSNSTLNIQKDSEITGDKNVVSDGRKSHVLNKLRPLTAAANPKVSPLPQTEEASKRTSGNATVRPKTSKAVKYHPTSAPPSYSTNHKLPHGRHHQSRSTSSTNSGYTEEKTNERVYDDVDPDEYEADLELGKMSNRQRCKLDLRPAIAWGRLATASVPMVTRDDTVRRPTSQQNPFQGMKGNLGQPTRHVRYLDKDEIEDRGAFYKYLVGNRLEREHTRFQDICAKIEQFCSAAAPSMSEGNDRGTDCKKGDEEVIQTRKQRRRHSAVTTELKV